MTENGRELEEVRRAHAALESRFDAVIGTLATKADLESTARQLGNDIRRELIDFRNGVDGRFEKIEERFQQMAQGFNRLVMWMAGVAVAILLSLLGFLSAMWTRMPPPPVYVYPAAVAPAPAPLAPAAPPP